LLAVRINQQKYEFPLRIPNDNNLIAAISINAECTVTRTSTAIKGRKSREVLIHIGAIPGCVCAYSINKLESGKSEKR